MPPKYKKTETRMKHDWYRNAHLRMLDRIDDATTRTRRIETIMKAIMNDKGELELL